MQCPKCRSKMTLLFTSAVCDVCDPPLMAGAPAASTSKETSKYIKLWVYIDNDIDLKKYFNSGKVCYPRRTQDEAHSFAVGQGAVLAGEGTLHQVYFNGRDCDADMIYGAHACPDETSALAYVPHQNAVWLVD